jgi:hypothetical protein
MEREGVAPDTNRSSHVTRRHTIESHLNKSAIDPQPVFLRERGKGNYGVRLIHGARIIEKEANVSRARAGLGVTPEIDSPYRARCGSGGPNRRPGGLPSSID